ncbi:MAG: RluA family pseudouridine synthase [Myxococcus sp.]|nr:RluA family pseudouridine synthase [Myxococcus sp.]
MASRRLEVPRGEKPALEKFLSKALPNVDLARARQLIQLGRVRVNGKLAKAGRKLWGGETIEVEGAAPASAKPVVGLDIAVLAASPHFLIVAKPSGLTVEPEPNQLSLVELVGSQRGGFDVAGAGLPGVVHRLDKDTSGALALATTDDGVALLKRGFEEKLIDKTYLAIVEGAPPETGSLDTPYARTPAGTYTTRLESPRRARLSWKLVERLGPASLLEVNLDTGRTHQIRVQLSEAGFPVLGDRIYGRAFTAAPVPRLALHALRLEVRVEGHALSATMPVPADLSALIEGLRAQPC